jgi:hypothetical protein
MHSWRVLILPFLESNTIYDRYRFDEPWDGPNNRTLLPEVPDVYQCPAHARRHGDITTSYFAVIGPNTAWPGADSRRFSEVFSPFNKILLLEGPPQKIAWSEPKDLSLEEAVALFSETSHPNGGHIDDDGFFYTTMLGRNCALADGAVRWHPPVLPPRFAEHLLRFDGELTSEEFDNLPMYYPRRLKWDNLLRLAILICLTALPLPWAIALWRKRLTAEAPLSAVHEQA